LPTRSRRRCFNSVRLFLLLLSELLNHLKLQLAEAERLHLAKEEEPAGDAEVQERRLIQPLGQWQGGRCEYAQDRAEGGHGGETHEAPARRNLDGFGPLRSVRYFAIKLVHRGDPCAAEPFGRPAS